MKIRASTKQKAIIEEALSYWKGAPSAEKILYQGRNTDISLKKVANSAGGITLRGIFIHPLLLDPDNGINYHLPSILLHEIRHKRQMRFFVTNMLSACSLMAGLAYSHSQFKHSILANALANAACAILFTGLLSALSNIAEGDARAAVAISLIEKNAPLLDTKNQTLAEFQDQWKQILQPDQLKTSVTEEQIEASFKSIGKKIYDGEDIKESIKAGAAGTRQAWTSSANRAVYNNHIINIMIKSLMMYQVPLLMLSLSPTSFLANIAALTISWGVMKKFGLINYAPYMVDKVAAITIPDYNPK